MAIIYFVIQLPHELDQFKIILRPSFAQLINVQVLSVNNHLWTNKLNGFLSESRLKNTIVTLTFKWVTCQKVHPRKLNSIYPLISDWEQYLDTRCAWSDSRLHLQITWKLNLHHCEVYRSNSTGRRVSHWSISAVHSVNSSRLSSFRIRKWESLVRWNATTEHRRNRRSFSHRQK